MARAKEIPADRPPTRRPERLADDDQLLVRAAVLIARGWCQGALARDEAGNSVEPWSESAVRWSPLGALTKAWYERQARSPGGFEAAWTAVSLATGGAPEEWNAASWRTRPHVLSAFQRARDWLPDARTLVRASA